MIDAEMIQELRKTSPNTIVEYIMFFMALSVTGWMVFRPDTVLWVEGIEPVSILVQPGQIALIAFFASILPLLVTQYLKDPDETAIDQPTAESVDQPNQNQTREPDLERE